MRCMAKYNGVDLFGVKGGTIQDIEIYTIQSEHGTPYLWVRANAHPEYMMPYVDMVALLHEWEFRAEYRESGITAPWENESVSQEELIDRWLEIYTPSGELVDDDTGMNGHVF